MERVFRKIRSFILGWFRLISGKTPRITKKRLTICLNCRYNFFWICKKCGCALHAKTRAEDEACPIGLW
jgi:rubrerythrin